MKHLESHNMLYDLQHGFRQHRPCETQLVSLIHELMTKNIQSDLILMDFAKAFDTVHHQRLLYKVQWYGIRGNIYWWIQSFLCEHTQKSRAGWCQLFTSSGYFWNSTRIGIETNIIYDFMLMISLSILNTAHLDCLLMTVYYIDQ